MLVFSRVAGDPSTTYLIMTASFTLAHLSDVHLAPVTGFSPRYWNAKRALGFVLQKDDRIPPVDSVEIPGSVLVVTRNVADFAKSPVPAITPADFLSQHAPAS